MLAVILEEIGDKGALRHDGIGACKIGGLRSRSSGDLGDAIERLGSERPI